MREEPRNGTQYLAIPVPSKVPDVALSKGQCLAAPRPELVQEELMELQQQEERKVEEQGAWPLP